jgi:hypothetical protein
VSTDSAVRWNQEQFFQDRPPKYPSYPYLSRVLDLPPRVAQAAFDAVHAHRARRGHPQSWDIQVEGGRLELSDRPVAAPPRACYWPYRQERGRIRSARWGLPIPVELELLPWSDRRTELGLRVCGHLPVSESLYLHVGHEALDVLAGELEAWALEELHDLERSLRMGHPL